MLKYKRNYLLFFFFFKLIDFVVEVLNRVDEQVSDSFVLV